MLYKFQIPRDELGDRLGRGIPKGALVVVEGDYGAGKSVLIERLAHGFVENGHTMTIVSTENTTMQFVEQMASLGYPVDDALIEGRLLFLPVHPILGFQRPKKDILERLLRAKAMYDRDIVAIDAFSGLLGSYAKAGGAHDLIQRLEELLFLFKRLCAEGKTIVLTLEPGDLPPDVVGMLKSTADVYLAMRIQVAGANVSRQIFVRRFERAQHPVADLIGFRVEPKAGFIVEIKNVS